MRISTSQMFSAAVAAFNDQQSQLSQLQQQMSTGKGLLTPSDNPVGAAKAVQLTISSSVLAQYQTNQSSANSALQSEDSTLQNASSVLQSIQSLMVRAGDMSFNDGDRTAIASEMQSNRNRLLELANTTDGQGNYLFAGFQTGAAPFANSSTGVGAVYNGDAGQRTIQVSDSRTISVADDGRSVFMSVAPGAAPVPTAFATNTGSGVIGAVGTTNLADPTNGHRWQVAFQVSGTAVTYTTHDLDAGTGTPASSPQPYTSGSPIAIGGQSVTISGDPANNDSFQVTPAVQSETNIFTVLDNVISAVNTSASTPATSTALTNALAAATVSVQNSLNNVLAVHASVGGREQEVNALSDITQTTSTQYQSDLQSVTSVDWIGTVSQFKLTQTVLQYAQQTFASTQNLSLFNYLK